ncbi:MAG: hypothetical protein QF926_06775 [Alphaproteobacteria bacterium]|jgi:hypothetical protein|nr:hypothetical protein [Alphaproteobacteria bacterium]|tara:strand:- start:151 stop:462 length:312 start_codon:yes stop_codon:yes gene_type:complete
MTPIEANARWIVKYLRDWRGEPLATTICVIEHRFARDTGCCTMAFATARAYAAHKGWIRTGLDDELPIRSSRTSRADCEAGQTSVPLTLPQRPNSQPEGSQFE